MIRNWSHRSRLATAIWILITCCTAKEYNNTITKTDDQRLDGPIIIPSLNEITLEKGQNFTLVCKGNNPIQLKQQHIPEDKFGTVFSTNQRNVPTPDPSYKYTIALDLYNVDHFAVGYYACYDDTIEYNDILLNIMEEPSNTEHVAFFYVYVNGTESIFAPMRQVIIARSGSKVVIGCRPTTPDIKVSLSGSNKTPELLKYSPKVGFLVKARFSYECEGRRGNDTPIRKPIYYTATTQPKPKIIGEIYFLEGETFSLNCTVDYQKNIPSVLTWAIPRNYSKGANTLMQFLLPILKPESLCVGNSISIYTTMPAHGVLNHTNEFEVTDGTLYNNITILTATAQDAGTYTCISKIGLDQRNTTFQKRFAEKGFINLTKGNKADPIVTNINAFTLHTLINAYPYANVTFYRDGKEIPKNTQKYIIKRTDDSIDLTIKKMDVYDTGIYTVVANNRHVTQNVTYDLRRRNAPTVNFGPEAVKKYMLNTTASLECEAVGYPLPTITWVFRSDNGQEQELSGQNRVLSTIRITSLVQIPVRVSGTVTCYAAYNSSTASASKRFLVHEIFDGFGIKNSYKTWFSEKQKVELTCLASIYDFKNLTWLGDDNEELFDYVHYSITPFSHVAVLVIDNILLEQAGNYTCLGIKMDDSEESQTMVLTVEAIRIPSIIEPKKDLDIEVDPYQTVQFSCEATAVPPPQIIWYKDEIILSNSSGVEIFTTFTNQTAANSTVTIPKMSEQYKGKYECIATSDGQVKKRAYNLVIKDGTTHRTVYLSIIGVIGFVLILLVIYLAWKIRKEKQFKQELAAAGLLYFKEGVTKSLNPELGIDEQAELLPYNEKFEFPADKLELGKQLGAGAFGVVYKAEARGIIDAEETTPVAVKMVKKTADNMYIKALASELKIMVHLGKHINIVNLLGACTQNVGKRELIVIVEYCKFGNIHNYMQRHREVFIDQLTDNKEKNLGKVNKAFSCSSGTAIMHSADYFGSNHTQETDHTFVNSANTSRSGRKVSETGYIPEWRSNYESDYSFDGRNPRPLTSRDLLAWAFQIARGMEYLASRKVLHGDLAARNVLLAEGNIVKICDFGLARSICKNDEYKKKENSPLPVKWLALECMTDRIFSTQSDVWSFGIVLWELFSLAKTPYPNISPQNLLQWLSTGHRLEKPPYADDRLYDVMMRCWDQKPTLRPSFSHLQEILGSFLEDNVRNHYVDLNTAYMDTNDRAPGDDYLAMVCAPDYNNMVTPSPHLYVNETGRFFPHTPSPAQLQHDDEGYLQMTPASQNIFSPRTQGTNFDFDARKLNPRVPEDNVHGSELTPMLRSSDLRARSGSDSDHDANSSAYLKMFSRISEEADEVFETKLNNIKNTQNTAVSNPTYIKFEADIEKKPNNISSNYINVNVPNGLVK